MNTERHRPDFSNTSAPDHAPGAAAGDAAFFSRSISDLLQSRIPATAALARLRSGSLSFAISDTEGSEQ